MARLLLALPTLLFALACRSTFDEPIRTSLDGDGQVQEIRYGETDGTSLNRSPYERVHFEFAPSEDAFDAEMDSPGGHDYLLTAFELDDQGSLFRPDQIDVVHDLILSEARNRGALIVGFVHGWKHNASPCDDNLSCFRKVLRHLAFQEDRAADNQGGRATARRVIGVYVGWRGLAACGEPGKELSFWERKRTAHGVGQSQAREVLQMLREVNEELNSSPASPPSRLVVVGHSFGAALVYSAVETDLKQQLSEAVRLARLRQSATLKKIDGFGDLVVLVNPAFEAELFRDFPRQIRALKEQKKHFAKDQGPVLIVVSSVGDVATHWAFPLGQGLNLALQPLRLLRGPAYWYRHLTTAGNHLRYRTHVAEPIVELGAAADKAEREESTCFQGKLPPTYAECGCSQRSFAEEVRSRGIRYGLAPILEGSIHLGNVRLTRTNQLDVPNNPFWVVKAEKGVIADHGDIFNPTFVSLLHDLVGRVASDEPRPTEGTASR